MSISRRTLLGAAGAAAVGAVAAGSAAPATASTQLERAGGTRRLRVFCYNIHHGADADGVLDLEGQARVIEAYRPDVVALQEVDRHWSDRSEWLDEAAWFGERLSMHSVYGANLDRDPIEPGQPRRQYGTAFLSKWPIRSWRNTHLPRIDPATEQRGLLEMEIRFRGRLLRLGNTHLQHTSTDERQVQAAAIIELLGPSPQGTLLAGDINAIPGTPEVDIITAELDDAWELVGEGDGFTIPVDNPNRRIDYIFGSPDLTPTAAEVINGTRASDHLPIYADYDVPKR